MRLVGAVVDGLAGVSVENVIVSVLKSRPESADGTTVCDEVRPDE
jgi:hypothetical protein